MLFDHQVFSSQAVGGVSRYFVELANQLQSGGQVRPTVLAPINGNRHFQDLDPAIARGWSTRFAPRSGKVLRAVNGLVTWPWLRGNQPALVHATWYHHARRFYPRATRVVVTVHDMIQELFPDEFPGSDPTARRKQAAVNMADHVICVSENTRQDLLRLTGIDADRVSVVHHGMRALERRPEAEQGLPDSPYLLYVGHRGGYKNFDTLLDAWSGNATLRQGWKLVCFGGKPFTAAERADMGRRGIAGDEVSWLGGDDAVLAGLYAGADALVYSSRYEGFGLPPLEAMAQDCPVVCSRAGAIPEVVSEAGELFDPDDAGDMAAAILRVVEDPGHAERLREAGRRRVAHFTWQRCAERTLAVYRRVCPALDGAVG